MIRSKPRYSLYLAILLVVVISSILIHKRSAQEQATKDGHTLTGSTRAGIRERKNPNSSKDITVSSDSMILEIVPAVVGTAIEENGRDVPRVIALDDEILLAGGIVGASQPVVTAETVESGEKHVSVVSSEEWGGNVNGLVNALRAGVGFEVTLETIGKFLRGEDLNGWTEDQRNWIGDEMMTILRQEMPETAYEIFKELLSDKTAPAAMRDYSIQHIAHLVAEGKVGIVGVTVIREALEANDPAYSSTALISLHRLSERLPSLISAEQVLDYARRYEESSDDRLRSTAEAILKENNP